MAADVICMAADPTDERTQHSQRDRRPTAEQVPLERGVQPPEDDRIVFMSWDAALVPER